MIAFAHIPKTAGTTLTAVLRRNLGWRHFDTRGVTGKGLMYASELRGVQRLYPALTSIAGHGVSPAGDLHSTCDELRYYTFVRDPIQRCLSHYQFALSCMAKRGAAPADSVSYFYDWIRNHRNWHARQLAGEQSSDKAIELLEKKVSYVGLMEQFDESLVMFRQWTGMALDIRYKSLNVASCRKANGPSPLRSLIKIDSRLAAAVTEANGEDLEIYHWVKENIYPLQRQHYGPLLGHDVAKFREANEETQFRVNDSLTAKAYRNAVFKPLRRFILPPRVA